MRGGKRAGAGRPKGSRSKHTIEREQAVAQAAEVIGAIVEDAFPGDAHAYLMAVYKNPKLDEQLRLNAAGKAIAYEKPALAAVRHSGDLNVHYEDMLEQIGRQARGAEAPGRPDAVRTDMPADQDQDGRDPAATLQ